MAAHTATAARTTGRHPHIGATTGRPIPRRLDPRRTARIMGVRVRPVTRRRASMVADVAIPAAAIIGVCDFDNDPTMWYPTFMRIIDAACTFIVTTF